MEWTTAELTTARLGLRAVDAAHAGRIRAADAGPEDAWAPDYPFEGDRLALGGFLRATERHGEQRPFGYYQIIRAADGRAIGGVGFKGRPQHARVEIGYGLAPSARGHGYAAEALTALVALAAELGVTTVRADTTADNIASQRTLTRAGFVRVGVDGELWAYEVRPDRPTPHPARQ